LIIGVDVDCVLRDIISSSFGVYQRFYDSSYNLSHKDVNDYFYEKYMPKINSLRDFYYSHAEDVFLKASAYNRVVDDLNFLKRSGNKIHVVTNQLKGLESLTLEWLSNNDVLYDGVHFVEDKNLVKCDVLVDDYVKNLRGFKNGVPVCFDQPYNKEWKKERVYSLLAVGKFKKLF
jgi:5'(3')-deoxyribonucleotidase